MGGQTSLLLAGQALPKGNRERVSGTKEPFLQSCLHRSPGASALRCQKHPTAGQMPVVQPGETLILCHDQKSIRWLGQRVKSLFEDYRETSTLESESQPGRT